MSNSNYFDHILKDYYLKIVQDLRNTDFDSTGFVNIENLEQIFNKNGIEIE